MFRKRWFWMVAAWLVAVGLYLALTTGGSLTSQFSSVESSIAPGAAAPPPAPPPPAPSAPGPVDEAISTLKKGAFAFQAPDTLELGKSEPVSAILSVAKNKEELTQLLKGQFPVQGADVGVSPIMTATLTGLGFEIQPAGPQTQAVSETDDTIWKWQVKPVSGGQQYLEISLQAVIQVQGQNVPRQIQQLDRMIMVSVPPPTLLQRIGNGIGVLKDFQWLWATLLAPAAVWLYARFRGVQSKPSKEGGFS
jgi:hypothetical protein